MRRLLMAVLSCALLGAAGPRPPYDMAATPDATTVLQHALNRCRDAATTTMRAQIDCSVAAHRGFAVAEHLADMHLFADYATALRQAADDSDAKRISPYEAQLRITRAGAKFRSTVEASYQDWKHHTMVRQGPLFDHAAYAAALTARNAAVARCGAWAGDRKAIAVTTACIRKAERGFAAAIKLADMDIYYGYDSVLTYTTAEAEDGHMTPAGLATRHDQIWNDFLLTLRQTK